MGFQNSTGFKVAEVQKSISYICLVFLLGKVTSGDERNLGI